MNTKLWTFIVEFEGGSYISQFETASFSDAIALYNDGDPSGQGAVPLDRDAVAITGTQGVFCATGLTKDDRHILGFIVATEVH